jgi:osmotically-inducible protein OsmY
MNMKNKTNRTDAELQQEVLHELKWDTRVDETDVGVTVDNAIVTLTGSVTSWAKRNAAQEAAHRVAGVLDVANDIQVHGGGLGAPSDTDIARAVRTTLEWDVFVPDERIRSTVSNGWVTLAGSVDTWAQHEAAEVAVRNLRGVIGITNELSVAPPAVSAGELHEAIEEALERRAKRGAQRIEVDVVDDRVVLSGLVHSWPEKQAVLGAVKGTLGVGTVDDRLQVAPFSV